MGAWYMWVKHAASQHTSTRVLHIRRTLLRLIAAFAPLLNEALFQTIMTGNATFQVDPAGDLNLLVRHHGQDEIFKVSSKVMSLASPVWRTMLDPNGPFRESKPDNGEVAFPDDEAEAMLIILLAAHLRNQEVPQAIVYQQLLSKFVVPSTHLYLSLLSAPRHA